MLRVIDIVDGTSVDGPGLRTSIYFAGCDHRCPGCHNPSTWDFRAGSEMTVDQLMRRIIDNDFNVTFSGGDPLYQLQPLTALARAVKAAGKTIWCYTGFIYEDLLADKKYSELLSLIDVLVDGPFIMSLRDPDLPFRGSSNQRLIDLNTVIKP
ncbi:MAG: anaerobic ribonucleoside-triphosphate reductase activating protein [Muribaculaceae bacterium]|nr:anaerobic ribonucleoside-triphosphate reductase activating protein [Muribaculaceae bacterium]